MNIYELAGWRIEVDTEKTQVTYTLIEKGGSEQCRCSSCRNFLLTVQSSLPAEIIQFMNRSKISVNKDAEVYNFGTNESNLVLYAGEYYFWGRIIDSPSSSHGIIDGTEIVFRAPTELAQKEFQSPNAVGLYFETLLPWVLDEPTP